jgi:hypothetical protein
MVMKGVEVEVEVDVDLVDEKGGDRYLRLV